mmetsp:Transcript_63749/g.151975  ORF Transcript_63749/g.151975 Transcript_63749/m.151975 type:complete len:198 (-) Transcript_63749:109-702(-)|eukprot:CAMPEP_0178414084 /NCGR_PEP_ID=MMETSP0689_2-20121128/22855_1 /TAXON_ID=160604 /ORGANISM="Amphidinium massartii, Strain CS-259" /LENGTH=197 /DNA_ID=CAMNT_0020035365 /DNA_START=66 /DNA_END=659 /DNA_ORIENTATION=+
MIRSTQSLRRLAQASVVRHPEVLAVARRIPSQHPATDATAARPDRLCQWSASHHRSFASPADVFKLPEAFQTFSKTLDAEALIKELNSQNRAFMLTKTTCPFCAKAKALFKSLEVKYSEFAVDMLTSPEKKALAAHLREATGAGSVPRVYVDGKCLGGCSEVYHAHFEGELVPKLIAAGVADPSIADKAIDPGNPNL